MDASKLESFLNKVEEITKNPEKYLSLQEDQAEVIKLLTQKLYNFTKKNEHSKKKVTNVLNQLVISNLDEEQIWQQIELQNNSVSENFIHDVASLLAKKNALQFPIQHKIKKPESSDRSLVNQKSNERIKEVKIKKKMKKQKIKSSVVDDKFFKLHEMENFLEKVEKEEEGDETDETNETDDEIDYFEEDSSNLNDEVEKQLYYKDFFDQSEEEENSDNGSDRNSKTDSEKHKAEITFQKEESKEQKEDESLEESASDLDDSFNFNNFEEKEDEDHIEKFTDEEKEDEDNIEKFTDEEKEDEDNNEKFTDEEKEDENNIEKFTENEICNDNDEEENEGIIIKEKKENFEQPSTFEARQERIKTRIKNLEEEALKEKPWQLKGEITAKSRPQNSLLEEYVEFDIATRPAPVFTEKSTLKLEDVIIQRIKDKAWDDVIRKFKPIENDIEYKKKLVLDQEKSKLNLAQIYEQEYLKQLDNKNNGVSDKPEIEPPEYQEIKIMMNKLFSKLDALSNFHFTPKQVHPEANIISNLPAINMEEVAPVAASDATLLAPEEVKPKLKGDLIGKSERTATDKKRERRQKKLKQKLKFKQMEAKEKLKSDKVDSKDSQNTKMSQSLLQKITKSSNITQLEENKSNKYVKSSAAFFSKLQNETSNKVKKRGLDVKMQKLGKKSSDKKLKTR